MKRSPDHHTVRRMYKRLGGQGNKQATSTPRAQVKGILGMATPGLHYLVLT